MSRAANRRGIIAMLFAVAVFSVMDTGLKLLSPHYPAIEVTALRSLASLPLVLAYVAWRGGFRRAFHVRWPLHLLRGALGIFIVSAFTLAVRRLPLAEAYSLFFVAPILITALSALVLKDRVEPARWIAVVAGMIGVLIVLRPTGEGLATLSAFAVLGAAAGYAVSAIVLRILGGTDSADSLVLWPSVIMTVGATAVAAPAWVDFRPEHTSILAATAISNVVGQISITEAFRQSEPSAVAPFEYTGLAWGITVDWLLWKTLPDPFTLLGAAIIIGTGVYLVTRETVHVEAEHP
jgi:drug/metabolite transporter (DMT)-like permease